MADDRKKVSSEQLLILIEEIEKDSSLGNGRVSGAEARDQYNEKWEHLANKLNSVDNGAMKNIAKWQQAWRDWKSNTKKKAAKFAKEKADETNSQPLTPLEQRVLEMSESESPERQNGIDISHIAEVDQSSSSSSDSEESEEDSGDSDSNPASDVVTLYSEKDSDAASKKRSHSVDDSKVGVKRRRYQNITLEKICRQNRRIAARLSRLEQNQLEFQQQHTSLLGGLLAALERQLAMEERLGCALDRVANLVDNNDNAGPGG